MNDPNAEDQDRPAGAPAFVVGGRWEVQDLLGAGAYGRVHRARDKFGGVDVAVKFVDHRPGESTERFRREGAALQALAVPGVVRFIETGIVGGSHYLVTELVAGRPFPGLSGAGPWGWEAIAPVVLRLLQVVGGIHAFHLVHRDLKPSNILVDEAGTPVVLDFGLVRGSGVGSTITRDGQVAGTPRYFAPEQARGEPTDARADLYAVGAMVFEALTGRAVHEGNSVAEVLHQRASSPAPPVGALAPGLPTGVAGGIDRLLSRRPEDRPSTAAEAARLLQLGNPQRRRPVLGFGALLLQVTEELAAGTSVDVWGPPGCGKSTLLGLVTAKLKATGRAVRTLKAGRRAFESLLPHLGAPPTTVDMPRWVEATLHDWLGAGDILVIDDPAGLDRWSAPLVARWDGGPGAILRAAPGGRQLPRLTQEDLHALFAGPDRLLHLAEDAATELWRRTEGLPRAVVDETEAWIGAGIAEVRPDGRLRLERAGIERLRAGLRLELVREGVGPLAGVSDDLRELAAWVALGWPHADAGRLAAWTELPAWQVQLMLAELQQDGAIRGEAGGGFRLLAPAPEALRTWHTDERAAAHRTIAATLPEPSAVRFAHRAAGGEWALAGDDALALGATLTAGGHAGRAVGFLEAALQGIGEAVELLPLREALLLGLLRAALSAESRETLERVRARLAAERAPSPQLLRAAALAGLAQEAGEAATRSLLTRLVELGTLDDEALERRRQDLRFMVARDSARDEIPRLLAELSAWAGEDPGRRGLVAAMRGTVAYSEERYDDAVRERLEAANLADGTRERLIALMGAAAALLDDQRLPEAHAVASKVAVEAAAARMPALEARATWALRSVAYRSEDRPEADDELAETVLVEHIGSSEGQILLHEAAVAFRTERWDRAVSLATAAAARWDAIGFLPGADLARALSWACAPPEDGPGVHATFEGALISGAGTERFVDPTSTNTAAHLTSTLTAKAGNQLEANTSQVSRSCP